MDQNVQFIALSTSSGTEVNIVLIFNESASDYWYKNNFSMNLDLDKENLRGIDEDGNQSCHLNFEE